MNPLSGKLWRPVAKQAGKRQKRPVCAAGSARKGGKGRMLMGEYQHNMDAKGRITIPSRYREELGETFYVSKGLDGCLTLYSEEQWRLRVAKINELPDSQTQYIRRNLYATTEQVTPDKQGRILISPTLRRHAGLVKDVTVIGVGTTAEIWDSERWNAFNESMSSEQLLNDMKALNI